MNIKIELCTDNAAFEGDERGPEVARILHSLAYSLDGREGTQPELLTTLRDINGNVVGKAWSEESATGAHAPKTDLISIRFIAPAIWMRYLTTGNASGLSDTQRAHCNILLRDEITTKGAVHYVVAGEKHPNCKIALEGCKPVMGMTYTFLVLPKGK